jgi:hypothetical protein
MAETDRLEIGTGDRLHPGIVIGFDVLHFPTVCGRWASGARARRVSDEWGHFILLRHLFSETRRRGASGDLWRVSN